MYVIESYGEPLTHQKIVPGNTATAIGAEFVTYTERLLPFTSGGTHVIAAGEWIVGATSAAKAQVVSVTLTGGAFANGDAAGTLRIRSQHGTFQSEKIFVAGGSDDATITANSTPDQGSYTHKGKHAIAAVITVTGNTTLVNWDGGIPDQTALVGMSIAAASAPFVVRDPNLIRNFKCIDYASGSASTVQVTLYF